MSWFKELGWVAAFKLGYASGKFVAGVDYYHRRVRALLDEARARTADAASALFDVATAVKSSPSPVVADTVVDDDFEAAIAHLSPDERSRVKAMIVQRTRGPRA